MTRDYIERRIRNALHAEHLRPPVGRLDDSAVALRALAREPGGAEAVAEAVGVRAVVDDMCGEECPPDCDTKGACIVAAEPEDCRGR